MMTDASVHPSQNLMWYLFMPGPKPVRPIADLSVGGDGSAKKGAIGRFHLPEFGL
jgi:hypothetical protein